MSTTPGPDRTPLTEQQKTLILEAAEGHAFAGVSGLMGWYRSMLWEEAMAIKDDADAIFNMLVDGCPAATEADAWTEATEFYWDNRPAFGTDEECIKALFTSTGEEE